MAEQESNSEINTPENAENILYRDIQEIVKNQYDKHKETIDKDFKVEVGPVKYSILEILRPELVDYPDNLVFRAISKIIDPKLRSTAKYYWQDCREKEEEQKAQQNAIDALERIDLLDYICREISKFAPGNDLAKKTMVLSGVGICHERELRLLLSGDRGTGKSFTSKQIANLFPKRQIYDEISPKAPYYQCKEDPLALDRAIVVYDDTPANITEGQLALLKSMTSTKGDRRISTVQNMKHLEIEITGSFSVWISCVKLPGDDQFQDRFLVIPVEANLTYNRLVSKRIKDRHKRSKHEKERLAKTTNILKFIFQKLVEDTAEDTFIPYMDFVDESLFFGYNRGLEQFLTLVECSALLYKYQRPRTEENEIIATIDDINIAWSLMKKIMALNITDVKITKTQQKILDVLPASSERVIDINTNTNKGKNGKTLDEIARGTNISTVTVRKYLTALKGDSKEDRYRDVPILVESYGSRGKKEYYKLDPCTGTNDTCWVQDFVPLFKRLDNPIYNNNNIIEEIVQKVQEKERDALRLSLSLSYEQNFVPLSSKKGGDACNDSSGSRSGGTLYEYSVVSPVRFVPKLSEWIDSLEGIEFTFKEVRNQFSDQDEDSIADALREFVKAGIIFEPRPNKFKKVI